MGGPSTDQRAEEGIFYRINPGKLTLDQQGEACGKIKQASQLSKSNEEQFTEIRDFVLAGHIALVEKKRQVALEHYKKAIAMAKDLKGFLEEYYRDVDILFRNGVTKDTIELVLEVVLIDKFR